MATDPTERPEKDNAHKRMSRGEKLFNWLVYGGIGYIFTFIITVPIAWALEYHTRAAVHFGRAVQWFGKTFSQSPAGSRQFMQTITLHVGGLTAVPLIWVAEKFKVPAVERFNGAQHDPAGRASVAEAPKQTIVTLFFGRLGAWATVFVSLYGGGKLFPRSFATFEHEFATRACKLFGYETHTPIPAQLTQEYIAVKGRHDAAMLTGGASKPLIHELQDAEKALAKFETKPFQYSRIASLDVFATMASATLLYLASHALAGRREKHIEAREGKHEPKVASGPAVAHKLEDTMPKDIPLPKIEAASAAAQKMAPEAALRTQL